MKKKLSIRDELHTHFREDIKNFSNIAKQFEELKEYMQKGNEHMEKSNAFMENLGGFNDVIKGGRLLKSPLIALLAVLAGVVIFFGNIKIIGLWFLNLFNR